MIYHDSIEVTVVEVTGYDDYGTPILDTTYTTVRGEVFAVDSVDLLASGAIVGIRYRVILAPGASIPDSPHDDTVRLGWGAYPIDHSDPFGVSSGMRIDGGVERHVMRGRLHHLELVTKAIA
ncbi:Uncharacterised protein [Mycolicibacterium vanbaalenii]|uniref:Uncharacterized protein n=1 Tax=Mycolicibacterium vanbaalenii TaxID=110539 RepID=A0A5S9QR74_MYCVN|nr:hypothetical protein [Mycolicibacterium vanbaalenii]CAA0120922.1 Uncharacterised protein [Mycolicibacterium vanbaalenii]